MPYKYGGGGGGTYPPAQAISGGRQRGSLAGELGCGGSGSECFRSLSCWAEGPSRGGSHGSHGTLHKLCIKE